MSNSLRISLDTCSVFNPVPLVRERVYSVGNGAKLFAIETNSNITLLICSSRAIEIGPDYYSRRLSVCGKELTLSYPGVLDLDFVPQFYTREKSEYHVREIHYGGAEHLGALCICSDGRVTWDGCPVDITEIQRLYTKCRLLGG